MSHTFKKAMHRLARWSAIAMAAGAVMSVAAQDVGVYRPSCASARGARRVAPSVPRLADRTVVRSKTVLFATRSLPQMKRALPQPTAAKLSTCGLTCCVG